MEAPSYQVSVRLGPRFRYCFLSPGSYAGLASRYRVRRQLRPQWTFTTDVGHARHTEKGSAAAGAWRPLIPLVDAMFLIIATWR